jgi:glycosyltransferase involved in cell wall biosynthesis
MGYERDKVKIFSELDICVVPSCFGDPFPTVAMEAGVYGLPVVATRCGGLPEIIEDGVTGLLVDPEQPDQLANKIEWLIQNPEAARAMGMAARDRVFNQFTVEKMVEQFESLFREHLSNAPGLSAALQNTHKAAS